MAENPTSSSTTYTTFGAPSGALGGSNGVQSGTESLMSTLMVPLNALLIGPPVSVRPSSVPVLVLLPAALLGSAAEQLGLGGGELLVGQRALLAQLVELVEHGRSLGRGRLRRWLLVLRRWLLVLLLVLRRGLPVLALLLLRLEVRDALVLLVLRVCRFLRFPGHVPACRVRATADHGRAHQWASPHHDWPPSSLCWSGSGLLAVVVPVNSGGQGKAEGNHKLRRGGDDPRPADLRRDGLQYAEEILGRAARPQRVGHLPEVRGRGRVERDQGCDLDERVRATVQ